MQGSFQFHGIDPFFVGLGRVARQIRVHRPTLHNRRLRLIHSGRLLTDGTFLYGWLTSLEGRQRRAKGEDGDETDAPNSSTPVTWLHCSIGAEMAAEDEEEAPQPVSVASTLLLRSVLIDVFRKKEQTTPLRGFDRLQTAGFTEDEIETIRRQFRSSRGLDDNPAPLDDECEIALTFCHVAN